MSVTNRGDHAKRAALHWVFFMMTTDIWSLLLGVLLYHKGTGGLHGV
jgi:hypothetical protein